MDTSLQKIAQLRSPVDQRAWTFLDWSRRVGGFPTVVVEAYRTPQRQLQLYAQGRQTPGPIVTWTQTSKHTEGRAFDVAFLDERGRVTWDVPRFYWDYLGRLGAAVGLRWGGSFGDLGHFEL